MTVEFETQMRNAIWLLLSPGDSSGPAPMPARTQTAARASRSDRVKSAQSSRSTSGDIDRRLTATDD